MRTGMPCSRSASRCASASITSVGTPAVASAQSGTRTASAFAVRSLSLVTSGRARTTTRFQPLVTVGDGQGSVATDPALPVALRHESALDAVVAGRAKLPRAGRWGWTPRRRGRRRRSAALGPGCSAQGAAGRCRLLGQAAAGRPAPGLQAAPRGASARHRAARGRARRRWVRSFPELSPRVQLAGSATWRPEAAHCLVKGNGLETFRTSQ